MKFILDSNTEFYRHPILGCLPEVGMSWSHILPVATPLVGFTGDVVTPLVVANLMVTLGKYLQLATRMVEFIIMDMSEGAYNGIIGRLALSQFEVVVSLNHLKMKFPMR
ncbi:hypothetical protein LIER_16754 [Lithospermum erythrorhizon]|uniref:Uncharacterized protein n=1 Tax=Lithospermum erythrorhizon TaxID=34254 RepID=A0AAV3Q7U9_LITER